MSLIQLSSKGSQNSQLNDFKCYFNRGLKIKPNSKIGLISATLQSDGVYDFVVTASSNKCFFRFGHNPFVHKTLEVIIPVGSYTPTNLCREIELQLSKKQNYLPFKKLTILNNSQADILADKWLNFGTTFTLAIDTEQKLTSIQMTHNQVPATNTGDEDVLNQYKSLPDPINFKEFLEIGADFNATGNPNRQFNAITQNATGTTIKALEPFEQGGVVKLGMPIYLNEYVNYANRQTLVWRVKRPTGGSWVNDNMRLIGLMSKSIIKSQTTNAPLWSDYAENVGWDTDKMPINVGVKFYGAQCFIIGLEKLNNEHLDYEKGYEVKDLVNVERTLSSGIGDLADGVASYYIFMTIDAGNTSSGDPDYDIEQGVVSVVVSSNADIDQTGDWICEAQTENKKHFFGTKAYPLCPFVANSVMFDDDQLGSEVEILIDDPEKFKYTRAKITETEVEPAEFNIPYHPEKYIPFNLNGNDDAAAYDSSDTGLTDDITEYSMNNCITFFSNNGTIATEKNDLTSYNINQLLTTQYKIDTQLLYGGNNATFGSVLGFIDSHYVAGVAVDDPIGSTAVRLANPTRVTDSNNPSYHIQLSSLPIKSLNSINHSITPTIAVIPKDIVGKTQTTITPAETQFINLNNRTELNVTDINVRITDADNRLSSDLNGMVELICMIKD